MSVSSLQFDINYYCHHSEMSDDGDEADDQDSDDQLFSDSDDEGLNEDRAEENATRQEAIAKLVPPLPASEYGQMPASFNTQRVSKTTIETATVEASSQTAGSSGSPFQTRTVRPPLLPRDKYDGVDSDDESSSSDPLAGGDEEEYESEEDRPQIVGEVDVDMTDEQDEFIEFSRQTLGISDELWNQIIQDRTRRGGGPSSKQSFSVQKDDIAIYSAFVPKGAKTDKKPHKVSEVQKADEENLAAETISFSSPRSSRPNANPKLDSFEAVMEAMDAELQSLQQTKVHVSDGGRKGKEPVPSTSDDLDIEATMEAELNASLKEDTGDSEDEEDASMDYNLIKNFLESFKSQGGLSGPVGNLAGRLMPDWGLPRDDV